MKYLYFLISFLGINFCFGQTLYDSIGNLVLESGFDSDLSSGINIRNLPAGSYIISIQTPDGIQTKKFLKQNP